MACCVGELFSVGGGSRSTSCLLIQIRMRGQSVQHVGVDICMCEEHRIGKKKEVVTVQCKKWHILSNYTVILNLQVVQDRFCLVFTLYNRAIGIINDIVLILFCAIHIAIGMDTGNVRFLYFLKQKQNNKITVKPHKTIKQMASSNEIKLAMQQLDHNSI